jgi:hypothetical protein
VDALGVEVIDVFTEQPSQVQLVQHHDMIEELPTNGADEPPGHPVLPRALERRSLRVETETLDRSSDD